MGEAWRAAINPSGPEPAPPAPPLPVVPEAREERAPSAAGRDLAPAEAAEAAEAARVAAEPLDDLPAPVPDQTPRWATLVRKEVRLREDQVTQLAAMRRRVAAARSDRSEIITDNTLIRIAVDWLLTTGEERLQGSTEDELRRSLTQAPRSRRRPQNGPSGATPRPR